jgi:transcriptional regulator with XRE-family HTH domain
MSKIAEWRRKSGLTQADLAIRLGFKSRAHVSALESGAERVSAETAIAIDRLSLGEVPVAVLRPDLHDVRVITALAP